MSEQITPGKILEDELHHQGWNSGVLQYKTRIPANEWNNIISGKDKIIPISAEGLATAFGTSSKLWLNIQALYDSRK